MWTFLDQNIVVFHLFVFSNIGPFVTCTLLHSKKEGKKRTRDGLVGPIIFLIVMELVCASPQWPVCEDPEACVRISYDNVKCIFLKILILSPYQTVTKYYVISLK